MTDTELIFKYLKENKDHSTDFVIKALQGKAKYFDEDIVNDYNYLREVIKSEEDIKAYRKILDETFMWAFEDILSMFDKKDEFNIDFINRNTGDSLGEGISLKDEFKKYVTEKEKIEL